MVSAANTHDSQLMVPLLDSIAPIRGRRGRPRHRPAKLHADKAYTSLGNRSHLRSRGIKACIPSKTDQDAHRKAKASKGGRPPYAMGA